MSVAKLCECLSAADSSIVCRSSLVDHTNNEQQTTNNEITVYTTLANGKDELPYPAGTVKQVDGVEVHYFKRLTKDHSHFSPALYWKLWRTAKDFDIIHIHAWWNLVSIFSLMIALLKGKKVVFTPRGTLSSYSFNNRTSVAKKLFHQYIGKPLLKKCYIHTTSKREEKDIKELLNPKYVKTIPNLVELPWQQSSALLAQHQAFNGTLKLIFLSRVEQKKGLELLFDILAKADFPYHLEIAGTGNENYITELKALSKDLGIAEHITWLGMLHKDEKFIQLARNDLFVLPSYDENFANVVIESLFAGTPVWITENVGLSDYVSEKNLGWVCQRTEEDLAMKLYEAYERISKNEIDRTDLQKTIEEDFKETNITKKYLEMYTNLSSRGNERSLKH